MFELQDQQYIVIIFKKNTKSIINFTTKNLQTDMEENVIGSTSITIDNKRVFEIAYFDS